MIARLPYGNKAERLAGFHDNVAKPSIYRAAHTSIRGSLRPTVEVPWKDTKSEVISTFVIRP